MGLVTTERCWVIGIDPGIHGGIAFLGKGCGEAHKMPATERDIWNLLCIKAGRARAYIEKVNAQPENAVRAAFKFGVGYGGLRMALIAAAIPFEEVTPQKWQKEFGLLRKKGETLMAKKNRHKAKAQELWPALKITHAVADALLIAEYGRRQHWAEALTTSSE